MASSSDSGTDIFLLLKKRKRNSETYKRNVVRNAKVKGVQHTNYRGNIVPARVTGPSCNCKKKCFRLFREEDFTFCLETINGLSNKNEQDIYLQRLVGKESVKRHRARKHGAVLKDYTYKYFVEISSKKQQVCKKAFTSIYGISKGRARRLCELLLKSLTPRDMRGQHPKGNAKPPEVQKKIHDHILSFPRKQTHYSGKTLEYLDAKLDVKTMHNLFKIKYPDIDVKYQYYAKYFKDNFSLRFGRPQVDTCIRCEELLVKIRSPTLNFNGKKAAEAELVVHKRRAKKFYNKLSDVKDVCQNRDDVVAITFDFMKNLPIPCIPIQEIFYLRQLWVNCFGIKNLKTNQSVFYVYHEGQANKGANEVCSMLFHYMQTFLDKNVTELILFSDNCPGQNKNHTMVRFLLSLTDTQRFSKVTHYFPIRGHSFLPNDLDFGVIKSKIKKYDQIYVPEQYYSIVAEAGVNFAVFELKTYQILDFNSWWPLHYKKNCLSNESSGPRVPKERKNHFSISTFMTFEYKASDKGVVVARDFVDGMLAHTFNLSKNRNSVSLPNKRAYPNNSVSINPKKMENIKKVYPSIQETYHTFYQELFCWPTGEKSSDDVESDQEFDFVP